MLGRVRPSSCSADSLERPPPKIFKDDSLSIYEATLMKLKLGSQRDISSCSEKATKILPDSEDGSALDISQQSVSSSQDSMTIYASSSFASTSPNSSNYQSTVSSKHHTSRNASVIYLFSNYGSSRYILSSPGDEAMR